MLLFFLVAGGGLYVCVRVWHLCEFVSFWHLQWQPETGQE
jgi:hypothetical protein